jgi:hypothetical protein
MTWKRLSLFIIFFTACALTACNISSYMAGIVAESNARRRQSNTKEEIIQIRNKFKEINSVINSHDTIPSFPWPPPMPSSSADISLDRLLANFFASKAMIYPLEITLGDVQKALVDELKNQAGYEDLRYYSVSDGFALVTPLEEINENGSRKTGDSRSYAMPMKLGGFNLQNLQAYMKNLFHGKSGLFRLNVFIVSPHPFRTTTQKVSTEQAAEWFGQGSISLPFEIKEQLYSSRYLCTVLVYEFEKLDVKPEAYVKFPPLLSAQTHLKQAGLNRLF